MSSKWETVSGSKHQLAQHYEAEWMVKKLFQLDGNKSTRGPPFAPLPDIFIQFCWEVYCHAMILSNRTTAVVHFMLRLVKLTNFDVPPSLRLKTNVAVKLGHLPLKECRSGSSFLVHEMDSITYIDFTLECVEHDRCAKHVCCYKRFKYNPLFIQSNLIFLRHLDSPLAYSHQILSLENLERFVKDFSVLYNTGSLSDIIIVIGDKKMSVHKAILIAHSSVLRKMLENDTAKTNTLTIVDIDYEIFVCFLKFLYSAQIEDQNWAMVKQLYLLAIKYDVQTLKKKCVRLLESQLSVTNLCEILELLYDFGIHDNDELKKIVKQFAVAHSRKW